MLLQTRLKLHFSKQLNLDILTVLGSNVYRALNTLTCPKKETNKSSISIIPSKHSIHIQPSYTSKFLKAACWTNLCNASENYNHDEKTQPSSTDSERNGPTDQLNISCFLSRNKYSTLTMQVNWSYHQFLRQGVVSAIFTHTHSYVLYIFLLIISDLSSDTELRIRKYNNDQCLQHALTLTCSHYRLGK